MEFANLELLRIATFESIGIRWIADVTQDFRG